MPGLGLCCHHRPAPLGAPPTPAPASPFGLCERHFRGWGSSRCFSARGLFCARVPLRPHPRACFWVPLRPRPRACFWASDWKALRAGLVLSSALAAEVTAHSQDTSKGPYRPPHPGRPPTHLQAWDASTRDRGGTGHLIASTPSPRLHHAEVLVAPLWPEAALESGGQGTRSPTTWRCLCGRSLGRQRRWAISFFSPPLGPRTTVESTPELPPCLAALGEVELKAPGSGGRLRSGEAPASPGGVPGCPPAWALAAMVCVGSPRADRNAAPPQGHFWGSRTSSCAFSPVIVSTSI
ncbi:uncharacterized protein LOC116657491 isoform X2 [Camelus ferus]|uniref:Uncharacterized protein LOC116657491 isoform X2 n=1 Tax=Camelus ferus TaxID=419612 RepID=A0A8B8RF60_CAMFR|nr:uncharacterized protein LOC116657491 isoform X2 [Camelus ferus]